jgi:hypothetical protein
MSTAEVLKQLAKDRREPDFAAELRALQLAMQHADRMVAAGRLTKAERADFDSHLFQKTLDALPVDDFQSMMEDGSLDDLQALAAHDGTRDVGDVEDAREAISRKIQKDALDEMWLEQRINSRQYAELGAKIEHNNDHNDRIADGDYDGAAAEQFASRHDTSTHEADLHAFLEKQYGKDYRGSDDAPRAIREEATEQAPRQEAKYDQDKSVSENLADYMANQPPAKREAVDANGIMDLDILAEQAREQD